MFLHESGKHERTTLNKDKSHPEEEYEPNTKLDEDDKAFVTSLAHILGEKMLIETVEHVTKKKMPPHDLSKELSDKTSNGESLHPTITKMTTKVERKRIFLLLEKFEEEIKQLAKLDWAILVVGGGLGAAVGLAGGFFFGGVVVGIFGAVIGAYIGVICGDLIAEAYTVLMGKMKLMKQLVDAKSLDDTKKFLQ